MLVVKVDVVYTEALERLFSLLIYILWIAFPTGRRDPKFGGEKDRGALLWVGFEPALRSFVKEETDHEWVDFILSNKILVVTINIGCIPESAP